MLLSQCYGDTAVGGYPLLCGLQVDTETQERQSSLLLCSTYLAKEGAKTSPLSSPSPPGLHRHACLSLFSSSSWGQEGIFLFAISLQSLIPGPRQRSALPAWHTEPEGPGAVGEGAGHSKGDPVCCEGTGSQWAVSKDETWNHRVLCQDHLLAHWVSPPGMQDKDYLRICLQVHRNKMLCSHYLCCKNIWFSCCVYRPSLKSASAVGFSNNMCISLYRKELYVIFYN